MKTVHLSLAILLLIVTGCANVKAPKGLESGLMMQKAKKMSDTLVYVNPAIDSKKYQKFILEPVVIYDKDDNDFGSIDPEDRQMMADFVRDAFIKAFQGSNFPIVQSAGPDVVKVKFTLIGLTRTAPAAQGLNYILFPIGTGIQVAKGVLGKSGTFMGNAVLAAEFNDSMTDDVVAALVTKLTANALNLKAAFSGTYGAAKAGVTDFMETIRNSADKSHGFTASTR